MTQSASVGPLVSLGGAAGAQYGGQPAEYSAEIGPSIFWQGASLLAMTGRGSKDKTGMGTMQACFMSDQIQALNQTIQPGGLALTTGANAIANTPLPLVTTFAAGVSPGAPFNTGVTGVGIETAFAVGAATAANPNITINANDRWRFSPGMLVSLGGAGAGGAMMFSKVVSAVGTTLTVSPAPVVSQANCAIGAYYGDPSSYAFQSTQPGGPLGLPSYYSPLMNGGLGRFFLPDCGCARGVGISGSTSGPAGINFLVTGFDIYYRVTSEIIVSTAGATIAYGKKTYCGIISCVPQTSGGAFNFTLVTSDLIGLPITMLPNQPLPVVTEGGTALSLATAGLQYGDQTNPATTSTSDPRGAIQLSTKGPVAGVTATFAAAANVTIVETLNPFQVLTANAFNPGPLFGVYPV